MQVVRATRISACISIFTGGVQFKYACPLNTSPTLLSVKFVEHVNGSMREVTRQEKAHAHLLALEAICRARGIKPT